MHKERRQLTYEQRCRSADLRIKTAVVEALPDMDPYEQRQLLVALHNQLLSRDEVEAYAAQDHGNYYEGLFFKSIKVALRLEPDIMAVVDIEKGAPVIGYIEGNSVHLFDD
jgi:hypothetical protein